MTILRHFVLSLLFILCGAAAFAQFTHYDRPWTVSKFSARVGGFWAINNTKLGASVGEGENAYSLIDFENELNMNRNTYSVLLNLNARFGKHNRVDLSYYNINRSSIAVLEKDINFGEHTYTVDSKVEPHLNTNILRLSYGYSFLSNSSFDLGVLVGFHVMAFNAGIDLSGATLDLSYSDQVKFTAPLPDLGIFATYAFAPRWAVSTELGYFYVKYKSLSGRLFSASLNVQYKLAEHWGIEAGYSGFDVRANLTKPKLDAELDWGYGGPSISVVYRFGRFAH